MEFRTIFFTFVIVMIASSFGNNQIQRSSIQFIQNLNDFFLLFHSVEADITLRHLTASMYLGDSTPCSSSTECLQTCKNRAEDPAQVYGASCAQFAGNWKSYCCCYKENTDACCRDKVDTDGMYCFVGGPAVTV